MLCQDCLIEMNYLTTQDSDYDFDADDDEDDDA